MSIGEIKDMLKSFTKFWFLSPVAVLETYQERKEDLKEDATTSLSVHRHYYRR